MLAAEAQLGRNEFEQKQNEIALERLRAAAARDEVLANERCLLEKKELHKRHELRVKNEALLQDIRGWQLENFELLVQFPSVGRQLDKVVKEWNLDAKHDAVHERIKNV